jgi:predicted nucleic acid-binding protein
VTGYLLDTNVLSELRKRERCHSNVRRWFASVEDDAIFLSVLVVGEIRRGIELIRRRDEAAARALDRWLKGLERGFEERILPVTFEISDRWGRIGLEQPLPPIDGLLAATALHHDLTLVTRNVTHARRSGADVLNPFAESSAP